MGLAKVRRYRNLIMRSPSCLIIALGDTNSSSSSNEDLQIHECTVLGAFELTSGGYYILFH